MRGWICFSNIWVRSEAFMAEYLEKYRKSTPKRIMSSWVKYVPWLPPDIFCECRENLVPAAPAWKPTMCWMQQFILTIAS